MCHLPKEDRRQQHHCKTKEEDNTTNATTWNEEEETPPKRGKHYPPPPPFPRERKGGERSSTNWQIIVPFFDRGTGTTIDIRSTWKHLNIDVFPDIPTTWRDKRWATSDTRLHAKNARDLRTIEACRCSLVSGYNTFVSQRLCARALERSECSKVAVFEKKTQSSNIIIEGHEENGDSVCVLYSSLFSSTFKSFCSFSLVTGTQK